MAHEEPPDAVGEGVLEERGHAADSLGNEGDVGRQDLAPQPPGQPDAVEVDDGPQQRGPPSADQVAVASEAHDEVQFAPVQPVEQSIPVASAVDDVDAAFPRLGADQADDAEQLVVLDGLHVLRRLYPVDHLAHELAGRF